MGFGGVARGKWGKACCGVDCCFYEHTDGCFGMRRSMGEGVKASEAARLLRDLTVVQDLNYYFTSSLATTI